MEALVSEPARDLDPRSAAQEELESILREAEATRRAGPDPAPAIEPRSAAGVPAGPPGPKNAAAVPPPGAGVRYERFKIKIPEPGENKIPAYQVSSLLPVAVVLGILTLILWILAPAGIQLLRPQPIPDSFVDASARWTLALTMQRINRFQFDQGRMPQSLEELDPYLSGIVTYQRLPDGGYILQSPGPKGMIALTTSMLREPFLGGSAELLRRGPKGAP
jgi:hypothetical protein